MRRPCHNAGRRARDERNDLGPRFSCNSEFHRPRFFRRPGLRTVRAPRRDDNGPREPRDAHHPTARETLMQTRHLLTSAALALVFCTSGAFAADGCRTVANGVQKCDVTSGQERDPRRRRRRDPREGRHLHRLPHDRQRRPEVRRDDRPRAGAAKTSSPQMHGGSAYDDRRLPHDRQRRAEVRPAGRLPRAADTAVAKVQQAGATTKQQ